MPGEVRYPIICLDAIVAIPVRNERERIVDCLNALEHQAGVASGSFGVVLFLNNCTDDTRAVVDVCARDMKTPVRLLYQDFDGANAGWARRNAMDAAAAWLAEAGSHDGCILTTDADSRVGPTWIRDNLAALARGVDAVAAASCSSLPKPPAYPPPCTRVARSKDATSRSWWRSSPDWIGRRSILSRTTGRRRERPSRCAVAST